jgi:hypothetical protein
MMAGFNSRNSRHTGGSRPYGVVARHSAASPVVSTTTTAFPRTRVGEYRTFMMQQGGPSKKIWFTEFG